MVRSSSDVIVKLTKSDNSAWTDDEVESLIMVANGYTLTAESTSSIDFRYNGAQVAYISRDYLGEKTVTVYCKANAFGHGSDYNVTYLGWDAPAPITLIVTPSPPVDLNNADVVLRKSDGSNFTAEEIAGLKITMGGNLLTLNESSSQYAWQHGGPAFLSMEKQESYGAEITLRNGGYEQNLNSIELT